MEAGREQVPADFAHDGHRLRNRRTVQYDAHPGTKPMLNSLGGDLDARLAMGRINGIHKLWTEVGTAPG
jgi:hypothetical protein